jgi:hypothetical protein
VPEPAGVGRPSSGDSGLCGISRKESIMKMNISNRIWRGIACGGLSLALLGGVGLPISACATTTSSPEKSNTAAEHRQEFRAMREKMLAQAKAEDAALQQLITELNKAPEAKKPDLEAVILTKLVAQHHQMVSEWESMHARMAEFRQGRTPVSMTGNSGCCTKSGLKGETTSASAK